MAPTVENGPYEILIRFNYEVGEKFGQLRGVSRAMKSYLVDENGNIAGRIDGGRSDLPVDFPADQIEQFLGQRFAAFIQQLEALSAERQSLIEAL